jgi:hypothetical protein
MSLHKFNTFRPNLQLSVRVESQKEPGAYTAKCGRPLLNSNHLKAATLNSSYVFLNPLPYEYQYSTLKYA